MILKKVPYRETIQSYSGSMSCARDPLMSVYPYQVLPGPGRYNSQSRSGQIRCWSPQRQFRSIFTILNLRIKAVIRLLAGPSAPRVSRLWPGTRTRPSPNRPPHALERERMRGTVGRSEPRSRGWPPPGRGCEGPDRASPLSVSPESIESKRIEREIENVPNLCLSCVAGPNRLLSEI
jgi:hypothetical protein